LPGKVVDYNPDTSNQLGYVTLQHDVTGNGSYDNYYVKYLHIVPKSGISMNEEFSTSQSIGYVDSYKSFSPHLHFESINSATSLITNKLFGFYRWVSEWNYGNHLDFLSHDYILNTDNEFSIYAYAATDNSTNIYAVEKIELYYKIGSSSTWTKSSTLFSPASQQHRWKINLKDATGANTGNTVYFYVVAYRQNDPTFSGSYKYAFWPQYYKHPSPPLSTSYANTIARSHTIY
jgi:hypothetical protein